MWSGSSKSGKLAPGLMSGRMVGSFSVSSVAIGGPAGIGLDVAATPARTLQPHIDLRELGKLIFLIKRNAGADRQGCMLQPLARLGAGRNPQVAVLGTCWTSVSASHARCPLSMQSGAFLQDHRSKWDDT